VLKLPSARDGVAQVTLFFRGLFSMTDLIELVNDINTDRGFPELYPGDNVRIHVSVVEGNRSRIQVFHGMVIINRGTGQGRTFTVRRVASHGIGVERTFLYKSPRIEKIEVTRHNKVRKAQLYYMRDLRGKSARLKEVREVKRNKPKSAAAYKRVGQQEIPVPEITESVE
jgi:large subunit ribosomal protein L19